MILHVNKLVKRYGDLVAVNDVTFGLEKGEILGMVGPNGAGKTTTLRSIAGIIPPTSGTISIAGFDLATNPVEAKKRMAFVPDDPRFFPYMTLWDHVLVVSRLYGVRNGREKGESLLRTFELFDRKNAFPGELSRGMKQKLGIILALLHDPELVVLDEPLTGLDPIANRAMKDHIKQAAEQGVSVIVSSHMLHLIEEICGRILLINKGCIFLEGTLDAIRAGLPDLSRKADLEDIFLRAVLGSDNE
jgi:ABC-2 type transport system ATP-binding protein